MITFDKLKIVTNIEDITDIDTTVFVTQTKDGEILYYKYKQETPYCLLIQADYNKQELVLEFTGKILMDDYPQLINRNNIVQCLETINGMGICRIDTEAILAHGEICKCDVTKDISSTQMQEIISQMKQSLTNYDKWTCAKYQGNGLVIYNTVKTDKYKKRLSIYDKQKELNKACNREFLNTISNRQEIIAYFQDKIRFELNIDTKAQIRLLLGVMDNRLHSVLSSNANPILTVFDEAIRQNGTTTYHSCLKEYMMALLIRDCHNDLEEVEAKIRAMTPKTVSIKNKMQPFRNLYAKMQKEVATSVDVRSLIA
jgi:hypothetical protein